MEMEKRERQFVLVHGACHGAWSWYKVATLLKSAGHKVTALDMAAAGVNTKKLEEVHSLMDYFEPLIEFMASLSQEERVILVGHSWGGAGLSIAMERFPEKISVAVFVTALMHGTDLSFNTVNEEGNQRAGSTMDTQCAFDDGPQNPPTSALLGPNYMSARLYHLSPPEDLMLATMLVRPIRNYSEEVMVKDTVVTKKRYGLVRRVFIVSTQDNSMKEDFQRWMIENNPPDEVKVISGSDHMPMFSKPLELSSHLLDIAENYS